jgi:hypothetical protein
LLSSGKGYEASCIDDDDDYDDDDDDDDDDGETGPFNKSRTSI